MSKNFESFASAIQYFEEIGPELLELERKVKAIKNSPEYKQYYRLLGVYANRGLIDEAPSFKNGYQIPAEIYVRNESQKIEDFLQNRLDKTDKLC